MKTIKDLTVEVTYAVGLGEIVVTDDVHKGLDSFLEIGGIDDAKGTNSRDKNIAAAFQWLADNIKEGDAFGWSYEIIDMNDE